jgi:hypothetical protein
MPLITEIPHRSEIEIHWGTTAQDVNGCIAVGRTHDSRTGESDFISDSRSAWDELMRRILPAIMLDSCWIEIIGGAK